MKTRRLLFILLALLTFSLCLQAQTITPADSTGLPGDNFSLEGALNLFKKSTSPETFEQMLNSEDQQVNNLDLNGDGETDYIKVIDKTEGNAHAFILQAVVSENESQDIAVIELEKKSDDQSVLQIVGDEDLYGHQTIVEPAEKVAVNAGTSTKTVVVNVQPWPVVQYVYTPAYVVWVSPWRWRAYPAWYRPWRPVRYHVFYGYRAPYAPHYHIVHRHRVPYAHRVYVPVRTSSVIVRTRYAPSVTTYRNTHVKNNQRPGKQVKATRATTRPRSAPNTKRNSAPAPKYNSRKTMPRTR